MKKYFAEFVGTFFLVFLGVGTAVIAIDRVGVIGVSFAFGLGFVAAAYAIGPVSGCHINPAVSLGMWIAGRLSAKDLLGYIVGQLAGATAGAGVVWLLVSRLDAGYDIVISGLGQNGWGLGYGGNFRMSGAIAFEFVATLIFVIVFLGATQKSAPAGFAGLVIGTTLVAIHLLGIYITGAGVNPARSLGSAVFVGGKALEQLWVFLVMPSVAGIVAGVLFRTGVLAAE